MGKKIKIWKSNYLLVAVYYTAFALLCFLPIMINVADKAFYNRLYHWPKGIQVQFYDFIFVDIILLFLCISLHVSQFLTINYKAYSDCRRLFYKRYKTFYHAGWAWKIIGLGAKVLPITASLMALVLSGIVISKDFSDVSEGVFGVITINQAVHICAYSVFALVVSLADMIVKPAKMRQAYLRNYLLLNPMVLKTYDINRPVLPEEEAEMIRLMDKADRYLCETALLDEDSFTGSIPSPTKKSSARASAKSKAKQ